MNLIRSCLMICFSLSFAPIQAADVPRKPNIVILLADDLGFADLGFQGGRDIPTPQLDALAKAGVRCTNGYVSGPYCAPTRAGLMTGRYQNRFAFEYNESKLPLSETTLANRLKSAGYATGLIGKWHLGGAEDLQPQKRGFDEFFGFLHGAHSYFHLSDKEHPILRGTTPVKETGYLTDAIARESVDFIERHQKKPFFLYTAFNAVHTPMQADDERLKRFSHIADKQRRTYAAMLTAMDEAVGKILDKLRSAGLEENTLVFFFSDNGGPVMPTTTVNGSINTPLRGSKRTTLDGGVHVPFVVRWKGKLPTGREYHNPIIQLDVLPTALAAAGIEAQPDWKLDGVNLLPHLSGDKSEKPHETLYWRFGKQMAIRHGDWKLVKYDPQADSKESLGRRAPHGDLKPHLYNLATDIGESQDQFAANPHKAAELLALWEKWSAELPPPAEGIKP